MVFEIKEGEKIGWVEVARITSSQVLGVPSDAIRAAKREIKG